MRIIRENNKNWQRVQKSKLVHKIYDSKKDITVNCRTTGYKGNSLIAIPDKVFLSKKEHKRITSTGI